MHHTMKWSSQIPWNEVDLTTNTMKWSRPHCPIPWNEVDLTAQYHEMKSASKSTSLPIPWNEAGFKVDFTTNTTAVTTSPRERGGLWRRGVLLRLANYAAKAGTHQFYICWFFEGVKDSLLLAAATRTLRRKYHDFKWWNSDSDVHVQIIRGQTKGPQDAVANCNELAGRGDAFIKYSGARWCQFFFKYHPAPEYISHVPPASKA